jgi:hypothetical protein
MSDQDHQPEYAARQRERCGACLGTGTVARWFQDGSIEPIDCDCCAGQGWTWLYANGQHRTRFGAFA